MKKTPGILLIGIVLGLLSQPASAQFTCGFDRMHDRLMKENPQYRRNVQAVEASIHTYLQQHPELLHRTPRKAVTGGRGITLGGSYTIPVVVHVIHTGGEVGSIYNPPDSTILSALAYLNAVYNGTWPNTAGAGDLGIQFVLAQRDPNCNPTNGINRVDGSGVAGYVSGGVNNETTLGTNEINIKNLSRWDNTRYYNIWIVNKIDGNDGTSGTFIAGYAYLPGAPAANDGIVMLATQMVAGQKTLPHEIGHAFDLYHPFNLSSDSLTCPLNTSCSTQGDSVCDTDPITYNYGPVTKVLHFDCRTGNNPCTGTPYNDNTESNYMNYTNCYTLFTNGQAARMQAAAISAYRLSLTTSLGGSPPSSGGCSPKIDFELAGDHLTETTAATSGCRSYKDYSYNMVIGVGPSAAATATLTVNSGTAVQGLDFDITTNGSFTSPSQQLTFAAGSATAQPFTIRVYDDAGVNGTRNFTLGFTLDNGGGNAVIGDGRPAFTMIIDDNDTPPSGGTTTGTASIGTFAGTINTVPFDATLQSRRTQFQYKASELTAAGIPAGQISGIAFNVQKGTTRAFSNFTINIGTTPSSSPYLVDGGVTLGSGMSTVLTVPSYTTTAGWNTFTFTTPFTWDGSSNLVVEICYNNGTSSSTTGTDNLLAYSDGGSASQGNFMWQDNIDCSQSFSSITYIAQGGKPITQLSYGTPPTAVQTTLNSSQSQYLGPNADVYFYDQTGKQLMARIQNLTSFDYGCTQVVIDRAGNSATQFWNNNSTNYLMDKTFHVLPTTNNPSGSYKITLYYTASEIAGWQSATSQNLSSIQLVKVPGQISSVTPASPNAAGTVTLATPTIGTLGSNTALTYNFTNGFSGFGAGAPGTSPLPIGLLDFNGRLGNGNILLNWSTSTEQNSKTFEIDRSFDGANFLPIGNVPAAGNSATRRDYSFTDPGITSDTDYYRLKEIDLDGHFNYSKIVLITTHPAPIFTVEPNPFTDGLDLFFVQAPSGAVQIRLLDITGRALWRRTDVPASGTRLHLNLPGSSLSAGVYLLEVNTGTNIYVQRVLKR
jgi:pregnancy-associated plasma protein-A